MHTESGNPTPAERVTNLLVEYARSIPASRPLDPELRLREDLAIESLSLASLVLRLEDELGLDLVGSGVDLGTLATVGDLLALMRR